MLGKLLTPEIEELLKTNRGHTKKIPWRFLPSDIADLIQVFNEEAAILFRLLSKGAVFAELARRRFRKAF